MKKLIILIILILFAGYSAAKEIQVGAITPLTGELAVYGEGFQQAMLLAVDEINSAGGINGTPLKIVFEDNGTTSDGSACEGVIGTYPTVHKDTPQFQAFKTAWETRHSGKEIPLFGEYY